MTEELLTSRECDRCLLVVSPASCVNCNEVHEHGHDEECDSPEAAALRVHDFGPATPPACFSPLRLEGHARRRLTDARSASAHAATPRAHIAGGFAFYKPEYTNSHSTPHSYF